MGDFSKDELLRRACLRVAMVIRGMWEEKGSSDTRLLDPPMIADELVEIGCSHACGNGPQRREHVIPRRVIIKECEAMVARGESDEAIAAFIQRWNRIVYLSPDEAHRLDRRADAGLGLRQRMPEKWKFGDDPYARLVLAKIAWEAFTPQPSAIAPRRTSGG